MIARGLDASAAAAWAIGRAVHAAARGRRRITVRWLYDHEPYARAVRAIEQADRRRAAWWFR